MRISDWSSDVCSSDLRRSSEPRDRRGFRAPQAAGDRGPGDEGGSRRRVVVSRGRVTPIRSEEHTSELQSLMRISYAVFCLKKKQHTHYHKHKESQNIRAYTQR